MRRHLRALIPTLALIAACCAACVAFGCLSPAGAYAQSDDWHVSASIDQTTANTRDILKYTIDIVGSGNLQPTLAGEPSFHGFTVTGRQRFTSIDNQNGRVVRKHHHLYLISPTQTGPLTIGPATIRIGTQTFTTDPVTVEVESRAGTSFSVPPVALPPTTSAQPPTTVTPPSGQQGVVATPAPGGDFFVEARAVDNSRGRVIPEVFVGQAFFMRYDLFKRKGLLDGVYQTREPQFTQFWPYDATDPNIDNHFGAGDLHRAGVTYESELLQAYVLVPLEVGELVMNPIEVEVHYGASRGRHWIASPETSIKVVPLPPGAPPGFDARNVGSTMSFFEEEDARVVDAPEASLAKMRKGDSVTFSLSVVGLGAVSHMKVAPVASKPGLHVYPPEGVNPMDEVILRTLRGAKDFKVKVVPLEEGDLEVPAVTFSYFDVDERAYKTLTAGPWKLHVEGASPDFDAIKRMIDSQGAPKGIDLGAGQPGLRSIVLRDGPNVEAVGAAALYQKGWYWALLGLAPALYLGVWLGGLWRERMAKAAPEKGSKRAGAGALKALKALRDGADPKKTHAAYEQLDQCLQGYLAAKTRLKVKGMTTSELQKVLEGKADQGAVGELIKLLNEARRVRYARGEERGVEAQRQDFDLALRVIEGLERSLK